MATRTRKATYVYLLMLSTVLRHSYCQPVFGNGLAGHTSSTFKQTHSNNYYPQNAYNYAHPAAKGYYPVNTGNYLYSHPLNGQYWTGQPYHYAKYPQNMHWQNGYLNHPVQYQNMHYQMGYPNYPVGYNNFGGKYPMFDANYWMGHNFHPMSPYTMNHIPYNPMYMQRYPVHHVPNYYHGNMMHHGQYPYHAVAYPAYPYYDQYYDRGFFGGSGRELTKGLLGALLVGAVAGTVARRG